MSEPLKPCPFCGKDSAEFERYGDSRQSTIVVCQECGAIRESSAEWDHEKDWNRRPIEDKLNAEIARLRAALETIAADRLPGGDGPAAFARRALEPPDAPQKG